MRVRRILIALLAPVSALVLAVVTSSVAIAGVLLVFCFLIVPSVAAMLFSEKLGARLAIGWSMGAIVTALGILLSFQLDLPTGATIVCTFGLSLLVLGGVWWVMRRAHGATRVAT